MEFAEYLPVWDKLSREHRDMISNSIMRRKVTKDTIIHNGSADCLGLVLVGSGQLRAYILSEEGREITVYRLFERDACLLSASCIMRSIQFEIFIQAEKDSEIWIIPPYIYKNILEQSAHMSNYANELMASILSEVMWLMEQIMWKSMDRRLAGFLLEESALEGTGVLKLTHERIGNHLGTAREVVTRMLRYFQSDGMVKLSRGAVEITDAARLRELAG